jgi:CO/xanthine dehydrogenase FAD-binding subunit
MYETTYHRASSVDEAVALFAKGKEAQFLAGGQRSRSWSASRHPATR